MSNFEKCLLVGLVWSLPLGIVSAMLAAENHNQPAVVTATVALSIVGASAMIGATIHIINM